MKNGGIWFEAISCRNLKYFKSDNSWYCFDYASGMQLTHVDTCMQCRFNNLFDREGIKTNKNRRK